MWNLNKSYNDCLRKAKGELLVFYQDFIWIQANGLQRFWDNYILLGDVLITSPGHKYKEDLKTIDEFDNRCIGEKRLEECNWTFWELNWASCPRKIMVDFNEDMDKNYGGENLYISHSIDVPVYLDRLNESKGLSQMICGGRPKNWESKHFNKTNKVNEWIRT